MIFGVFRAHGGKIAEENRCRSPVAGSKRLSLTRGTVTSTAPALVSTSLRPVRAVAHHQAAAVLAPLRGMRRD